MSDFDRADFYDAAGADWMSDNEWCYAARFAGMPGYGAIVGDVPEYAADTARTVADWIKRGATIERVTLEAAVLGMKEYRDAQKESSDE